MIIITYIIIIMLLFKIITVAIPVEIIDNNFDYERVNFNYLGGRQWVWLLDSLFWLVKLTQKG